MSEGRKRADPAQFVFSWFITATISKKNNLISTLSCCSVSNTRKKKNNLKAIRPRRIHPQIKTCTRVDRYTLRQVRMIRK